MNAFLIEEKESGRALTFCQGLAIFTCDYTNAVWFVRDIDADKIAQNMGLKKQDYRICEHSFDMEDRLVMSKM